MTPNQIIRPRIDCPQNQLWRNGIRPLGSGSFGSERHATQWRGNRNGGRAPGERLSPAQDGRGILKAKRGPQAFPCWPLLVRQCLGRPLSSPFSPASLPLCWPVRPSRGAQWAAQWAARRLAVHCCTLRALGLCPQPRVTRLPAYSSLAGPRPLPPAGCLRWPWARRALRLCPRVVCCSALACGLCTQ